MSTLESKHIQTYVMMTLVLLVFAGFGLSQGFADTTKNAGMDLVEKRSEPFIKTDKKDNEITRNSTNIIMILGKIDNHSRGLPVIIKIISEKGQEIDLKSFVSSDGKFTMPYIITLDLLGKNDIIAYYNNQEFASNSFTVAEYDFNKRPVSKITTVLLGLYDIGKRIIFSGMESYDKDGSVVEYF